MSKKTLTQLINVNPDLKSSVVLEMFNEQTKNQDKQHKENIKRCEELNVTGIVYFLDNSEQAYYGRSYYHKVSNFRPKIGDNESFILCDCETVVVYKKPDVWENVQPLDEYENFNVRVEFDDSSAYKWFERYQTITAEKYEKVISAIKNFQNELQKI